MKTTYSAPDQHWIAVPSICDPMAPRRDPVERQTVQECTELIVSRMSFEP